jgi:polyether ionophore transport system permease protein
MNAYTGTRALVRLALRRDRVMLPIWLAAFILTTAATPKATISLYPTRESLVAASNTFNSAQSLLALYGRVYDPTSIGALATVKAGGLGGVFVAILAIITVVRHTRAEEETGRQELVGAGVVGRLAPLTAALLVAAGTNAVLALFTALALAAGGLPLAGSFAFGLAWGGVGIAFAAVAAVTAQLTTTARSASSLAMTFLGVVYVLRAIGDAAGEGGPRWATWLSPIGWGQQFRPYAGNRWWVLLITLSFAAVVTLGAYALVLRRDLGSGLLPDRPGRASATPSLRSPIALAWRLQRGALYGWLAGFALMGLAFGNIATNLTGFATSGPARDLFTKLGGSQVLVDAYMSVILAIVGIIASAYGIQAATRMRAEETSGHLEPVLATAVSRTRWAWSHTVVALGGTTLLLVTAGLTAGIGYGAKEGWNNLGRLMAGALVQIPAAWILAGIVVLAFGYAPRLAVAGWAALAFFVILGEIGPLLSVNHWVMDVSPYTHVPKLPGQPFHVTPLVLLTALAVVLVAAGFAGFRRRDVPVS